MEIANDTGRVRLSHAKLKDQYVIRVAIGQSRTTLKHVHDLHAILREAAREVTTPA